MHTRQSSLLHRSFLASLWPAIALTLALLPAAGRGQGSPPPAGYDDHQNMMEQLGLKAIRGGPNPNDQSTFDEAKANPYKESMPDVLLLKDGTKVTKARQWPKRRAEILKAGDMDRSSRRAFSPTKIS